MSDPFMNKVLMIYAETQYVYITSDLSVAELHQQGNMQVYYNSSSCCAYASLHCNRKEIDSVLSCALAYLPYQRLLSAAVFYVKLEGKKAGSHCNDESW